MESIPGLLSPLHLVRQRSKRSFYAFLSLLLLCLLAYNSATIFCTHIPVPAKKLPEPASFSLENVNGRSRTFSSTPSATRLLSAVHCSVKEEIPGGKFNTLFPKNEILMAPTNRNATHQAPIKGKRDKRATKVLLKSKKGKGDKRATTKVLLRSKKPKWFESRVVKFFKGKSSGSSCELRLFMTWISSVESFGVREMLSVGSVFKVHPNACLIIVSSSLDSRKGVEILRPFLDKGFKLMAISPDFSHLFNGTVAQAWYNQLKQGKVNPGEVSLGQNLSNLLRMGLLYRYGGIYLDTDVIILKSLGGLRNAIGAQTVNLATRNWSRLNNAVLVFDKGHPLLHEFIEEFALTFDGNRWGHNGPYLVSRVVSRVSNRPGFSFTVLPPLAFYPVDWSKIGSLFEGPKGLNHSKWLFAKLRQIRSHSFALHLWNKQSRGLKVKTGSVIHHIMFSACDVCNLSSLAVS